MCNSGKGEINLGYVGASGERMKLEPDFGGWVGSTAAVVKPCLELPAHAQMSGRACMCPILYQNVLSLCSWTEYLRQKNWPEFRSLAYRSCLAKCMPAISCPFQPPMPWAAVTAQPHSSYGHLPGPWIRSTQDLSSTSHPFQVSLLRPTTDNAANLPGAAWGHLIPPSHPNSFPFLES